MIANFEQRTPESTAWVCREKKNKEGRDVEAAPTHDELALPPVDGGRDAWLFLMACFFVEALVWGEFNLPV